MTKTRFVPVEADQWSEASKRSFIFHCPDTEYLDRHYQCSHCKRETVYTAEEQKEAFEVHKASIWQNHFLCTECYLKRSDMKREVEELNVRWRTNRAEVQRDIEALRRWHHLLQELPCYGATMNPAHMAMLERLLSNY